MHTYCPTVSAGTTRDGRKSSSPLRSLSSSRADRVRPPSAGMMWLPFRHGALIYLLISTVGVSFITLFLLWGQLRCGPHPRRAPVLKDAGFAGWEMENKWITGGTAGGHTHTHTHTRTHTHTHTPLHLCTRHSDGLTAMKKLRIVILRFGTRDRKWLLNDGQIQSPSAQS
jgi:hypothetical protein